MNPTTFDVQAAHQLLDYVTQSLIELRKHDTWKNEFASRCPPILWFGNALANKPFVLTVGANPSRQEYLRDSSGTAIAKVARTGNDKALEYLEPPSNRFRVLGRNETLESVVASEALRGEIIAGYNRYFVRNPYRWFGLQQDPYNVEAFLRGLGASYYERQPQAFQAVHIDLFPFATLSDFKALQKPVEAVLFGSGWAQHVIARLIELFNPKVLVVFGRTNVGHFAKYMDPSVTEFPWKSFENGTYCTGSAAQYGIPLAGLSTNLGNPVGFNKVSLRRFGERVGQELVLR